MAATVRVEGLGQLRRSLRDAGQLDDLRALREGLRDASSLVASDAQGRIPSRTGRARGSVRATAAGNRALVVGGRSSVPYYGWLDFGSRSPRSGRARSVGPWAGTGAGPAGGRFIYKAIDANERQIVQIVERAVSIALDRLGL